jgi:hypothetical protein
VPKFTQDSGIAFSQFAYVLKGATNYSFGLSEIYI